MTLSQKIPKYSDKDTDFAYLCPIRENLSISSVRNQLLGILCYSFIQIVQNHVNNCSSFPWMSWDVIDGKSSDSKTKKNLYKDISNVNSHFVQLISKFMNFISAIHTLNHVQVRTYTYRYGHNLQVPWQILLLIFTGFSGKFWLLHSVTGW